MNPAWFERAGQRTFVAFGGAIGLALSLLLITYVAPARVVVASSPLVQPATEQAPAAIGSNPDAAVAPTAEEMPVQVEQAPPDAVVAPLPALGIQANESAPLPAPPATDPATVGDSATPSTFGGFSAGGMTNPPSSSYSPPSLPSSSYSGGGTVHVRGYYRKDGTYVRPHTRRSPRR